MKKKFGTTVSVATLAVAISACSPVEDTTKNMSQSELRQYCGVDLDKLEKDMKEEDPRIQSIRLKNTDCDVIAEYRTVENGQTQVRQESFSNDLLMAMVVGGGAAMMTNYLMSNSSDRSNLRQESERRRSSGSSAFVPMYMSSSSSAAGGNSRAYNAFRTGNKASGINVSNGAVTTRSNAFSSTATRSSSSTSARASGYSGGG